MSNPLGPEFARLSPAARAFVLNRMSPPRPPEPTPQQAPAWSQNVAAASSGVADRASPSLSTSGSVLPAAGAGAALGAGVVTYAQYADRLNRVRAAIIMMVRYGSTVDGAAAAAGVSIAEMEAMIAGASGPAIIAAGVSSTSAAAAGAGTAVAAGAAAGGEGGSLFGPLGILAGLAVGAAIAGGIYLWHRSSGNSTPNAVAAVATASPSPDQTPTPVSTPAGGDVPSTDSASPAPTGSTEASPADSASPAGTAGTGQSLDVNGSYAVQYGMGVGGCGSQPPPPTITVSASGTSVSVRLGTETMRGSVGGDGSFTATDNLANGTMYSITGTFVTASNPVSITNGSYDVTRDPSGCGYQFTAQRNG